jgi:hypothetical protein
MNPSIKEKRFFHRGLLLYLSLVPRKCPVSQAFAPLEPTHFFSDFFPHTQKKKKKAFPNAQTHSLFIAAGAVVQRFLSGL